MGIYNSSDKGTNVFATKVADSVLALWVECLALRGNRPLQLNPDDLERMERASKQLREILDAQGMEKAA